LYFAITFLESRWPILFDSDQRFYSFLFTSITFLESCRPKLFDFF
jgi:hypothetical protein